MKRVAMAMLALLATFMGVGSVLPALAKVRDIGAIPGAFVGSYTLGVFLLTIAGFVPMILSLGLLGYEVFAVLTRRLAPGDLVNGQALMASKAFWLLMALPALWFVAEVLTMLTNDKRRAFTTSSREG